MTKQLLFLIVTVFFVSTVIAQQSEKTQSNQTPQFSLEQQLAELNREISVDLTSNQKTTVAILNFEDLNGNVSDFGKFLAEELVTRLFKTKKLRLIDRREVEKIVAEQRATIERVKGTFKTKGIIEMLTNELAKRIGNQLGVKAIVIGTVTEVGKRFRINARIISTDTGAVISTAATTVAKDDEVCSLIDCNAKKSDGVTTISSTIPEVKSTPTPITTPKLNSASTKKEANLFVFDLQKCQLSGTSVFCDFTVTNKDEDRNMGITNRTVMFDNSGNQYRYGQVKIANLSGSAYLLKDKPVQVRVLFKNVSPQATGIALFRLRVFSRGVGYFNVEFRDLPLTQ